MHSGRHLEPRSGLCGPRFERGMRWTLAAEMQNCATVSLTVAGGPAGIWRAIARGNGTRQWERPRSGQPSGLPKLVLAKRCGHDRSRHRSDTLPDTS